MRKRLRRNDTLRITKLIESKCERKQRKQIYGSTSIFSPRSNIAMRLSILALCMRWCSCQPFHGWCGYYNKNDMSSQQSRSEGEHIPFFQMTGILNPKYPLAAHRNILQAKCHPVDYSAFSFQVREAMAHPYRYGWTHVYAASNISSMTPLNDEVPSTTHLSRTEPYPNDLGTCFGKHKVRTSIEQIDM